MTVIIAGGGIGGLSLGLSLHQLGIHFHIVEAVAHVKPLGVGINLQPHAVRELFELGLEAQLDDIGLRTEEVAYFSKQGQLIWSEPRGLEAGYRWPQYSIHRGELQFLLYRELLARCGPQVITTGAALTGWREDALGRWHQFDGARGALSRRGRGQMARHDDVARRDAGQGVP